MNYRPDKYGNQISTLGFGCMRLPSTLGRIDMEAAKAGTVDSSQHAMDTLEATKTTMAALSHAPSDFDGDIQKDQSRVVVARTDFEQELQNCVNVGRELDEVFRKRAKKLNLN